MKLIVGLGNPGRQYENTPHNAGFHAIDLLAGRQNAPWAVERRFEAMTASISAGGRSITLIKPLTYMNLSGRSVAAWVSKNGGEAEEILAISDDINLPMGRLRLRAGGSHGGQKGLLSIINSLGTLDFPRLRMGIRPDGPVRDLTSYVLARVPPASRDVFEKSWDEAADAIEIILQKDFQTAMSLINGKSLEKQ